MHHTYFLFNMDLMRKRLTEDLLATVPINRGAWQSEQVDLVTHELSNVVIEADVLQTREAAERMCAPDMPWAETHFQERVSGQPLNPPPSYVDWPWHSAKERDRHLTYGSHFDHTYPERYWPCHAGIPEVLGGAKQYGIRYAYGDLQDVVNLLRKEPFTRQAYLPVWFPEDTGAVEGQRVPCSLGYHFIRNGPALDVNYFLRSCDLTRHFRNDCYFTVRLLQWVREQLGPQEVPFLGKMTMFISNLHLFKNDTWRY